MEVSGDLSVTFKVHGPKDLQRIMEICKEFDGQPMPVAGNMSANTKRKAILPKNLSKQEVAERIIQVIKSNFAKSGFDMRDARALALEKLDRRAHTVQYAVHLATRQGVLMKKGNTYYFTDMLKERVAAKLKVMQTGPEPNMLPPIPAGMVS